MTSNDAQQQEVVGFLKGAVVREDEHVALARLLLPVDDVPGNSGACICSIEVQPRLFLGQDAYGPL